MTASGETEGGLRGGSILVVDDDRVLRERLCRALQGRGLEVRGAEDFDAALAAVRAAPPERAVIDLRMPGGSGLDLVRQFKALYPAMEIVVLSGYGSIATAVEALRLGAANFLPKPADVDDILNAFAEGNEPAAAAADYEVPSLARTEWEHINRVLADCGGNISEAARRLGIHRRSLQRKLQKRPPRS